MKIELAKTEIIHFVGIGGIGMSGLALIMRRMGFNVQGSDVYINKNVERLKKDKIKVNIKHTKKNVINATIVVVSSAIKKNNPELIEAKKKQLPIYKRGEMLANIVSLTKNIVVTGSHGKTTTTSLLAAIFSKTKLDPTIINGGVLNAIKSTAKLGKSDWCILEADESDGSFIYVPPTYSIVTNIDREHMDYYNSMNDLKNLFIKFINKVPSFGKSFICIDNKNNRDLLKKIKIKNFYTYGINSNAQFRIKNIKQAKNFSEYDLAINLPGKKDTVIKTIKIPLLGIHNILNSTAAAAVGLTIGISKKIIKNGLKEFKGVQRRFNKIFTYRETNFYDDYAHHPTEIKEVLNGVRAAYKKEEVICVFQPHRISRLKDLKKEFSSSFKKADIVILCPVYAAGEKIKLGFDYNSFAKSIIRNSKVKLFMIQNQYELAKLIKNTIYGKKIVVGMGAGSISAWMRELPSLI
ncbi:UDP-N-acetylmuramate--L-alanine ligase [Candidatus Pelagibacter ubique]|uniref:UDP-N-acetylmuramate--L-alanine ligase n=1 Tax=Pelagibacter ubique TaxID=198252 RepID=A0ABX1T1W1_PELUQ|nr:UDP-N-acetylmuramate--L-alanine ligase [Candidatus Pelagibacter ubique]NMN67592.1 UDP-N-acetylmuramate--L-alanine ligase [Candidatus Pelagibacter ubique]